MVECPLCFEQNRECASFHSLYVYNQLQVPRFIVGDCCVLLNPQELQANLAYFTGTTTWYRYRLGVALLGYYTDGVQYLAENAECYWLLGDIFIAQQLESVRQEPFQVWELTVIDGTGTLTANDGNTTTIYSQEISITDFPLPSMTLYVEWGEIEDKFMPILLLPSEH